MRKTQDQNKTRSNQVFNGLMIIGLSVLLFLILIGLFGKAGDYVKDFFVGVFGYAIYGYTLAMVFVGLLMLIGWTSKSKLGVKLTLGGIIAIVIAMCHIGTSKDLSALTYGAYLKQCYLLHSTAGGILGGIIFYPLSKVFVLSMVFLSLFLVGLIALLIVMHVNYELIVPSKANKLNVFDKKKNKQSQNIYNQYNQIPIDKAYQQEDETPTVLYNGTVDGKTFPDNFGKTKDKTPLSYVPLEDTDYLEEIDIEEPKEENKQNSNFDKLSPKQQEAIKILYDNKDIPYSTPIKKEVDVTNTLNHLNRNKKSDKAPVEPKIETPIEGSTNDSQPVDNKFLSYTNNFRKQQMMENMNHNQVSQDDASDDFINELENTLNLSLNKNVESVEEEKSNNIVIGNTDYSEEYRHIERNEEDYSSDEVEESKVVESNQYTQINLDEINPPRNDDKYKVDEDKIRQNRLQELRNSTEEHKSLDSTLNPIKKVEVVPVAPIKTPEPIKEEVVEKKVIEKPKRIIKPYVFPTLDLLNDNNKDSSYDADIMAKRCKDLEENFASFGIEIKVIGVVKGPAFSRIEFTTTSTLSKISNLVNDISMWLEVESLRLEAPIPGRNCCGIEIPNDVRGSVGVKEIIASDDFTKIKDDGIYFVLGKDIDGKNYISNIVEYPHGLIAGSSGSGKSVCLNAMIISLLYKYSPEELRFIMVDPKVVELNVYKDLPHMLIPEILNEPHKVIKALKWLCVEMENRYQLLNQERASNIQDYNQLVEPENKMPYILVLVDEVGDIMASPVKKEFEELIRKLAQKARAAGIHLILATQRPSVDVITGTIKANLATRIAFTTVSGTDSRTILDSLGAEKLLRYGDMLYKESKNPVLVRIQGAFIHKKEIIKVVDYITEHNSAYYNEEAYKAINQEDTKEEDTSVKEGKSSNPSAFSDDLCPDALRLTAKLKNISASRLQRTFRVGFNRAASIVDWMEAEGYIEKNKKNSFDCLISEEEAEEIINKATEEQE